MDLNINIAELNLPIQEHFSLRFYHHTLPLQNSPERITYSMICFCTQGHAEVEIDFVKYVINQGYILTAFPFQVVEEKFKSDDFRMIYFTCSQDMLSQVLFRFPHEFIFFLKENPLFEASDDIIKSDMDFLNRLKNKYEETNNFCQSAIIIHMIRIYYLEVFNLLKNKLNKGMIQHTRKTEIMKAFIQLLMNNYMISREVRYYAEKLNITPKYLSNVTLEINGVSAKKYIDNFLITEIKLFLKSSSMSIQQIAELFNFIDQSFFTKYFKHHTNHTPKAYRRN